MRKRKEVSRLVIPKPAVDLLVEFELFQRLKKHALANNIPENMKFSKSNLFPTSKIGTLYLLLLLII